MSEKEYIIPYSYDTRKRHYHKDSKGKVERFTVQLEINYKGKWREVVRYDCSHGFAHRDLYNLAGSNKKEELNLNFEEALTFADDDIDGNWESYKRKFLKGTVL